MTRRGLMIRIFLAVVIYAVAIGVGCDIRFRYPKREDLHYVLYKDLIPLIVAIPAAWLAYCFQRRGSYLQQLRAAWNVAVAGAQGAIRYTSRTHPSSDDHGSVLADLGAAIDGVRGLSRNPDSIPIASLEAIRSLIEALGVDSQATPAQAEAARLAIQHHWEIASGRLLIEFDRARLSPRSRPIQTERIQRGQVPFRVETVPDPFKSSRVGLIDLSKSASYSGAD
jgi:hypothetical protein